MVGGARVLTLLLSLQRPDACAEMGHQASGAGMVNERDDFHLRLREALGAEKYERLLRQHRAAQERRRRWEYLKIWSAGAFGVVALIAFVALV